MSMEAWLGAKGFDTAAVVTDGKIHRVGRLGHHSKSAWYVAWRDPFPVCVAGDWRTGEKWEFRGDKEMTPKQRREARQLMERAIAEAERERQGRYQQVALRADIELRSGRAPDEHPYLVRKGIGGHGAIALGDELLIPMHDIDGKIWGLQRILPDGRKFFLPDQRAAGCFFRIGHVLLPEDPIYICEGFATGASIYEAIRTVVFCAFSASNLQRVAVAARKRYPTAPIVIAGDNDLYTNGNPGKTAAEKAANALFLSAAVPSFTKPGRFTDFNDLMLSEGRRAVITQLKNAVSFAGDVTEERSRKYYQLMCEDT